MESRQRIRTPDGRRRPADIVPLGSLGRGRPGHCTSRHRGIAWASSRSRISVTVLAILLSGPASTPVLATEQYSLDLAKGQFDERPFRLVGPNASVAIDRKSGIVHLPVDRPGQPQVGIASKFRTAGDFEVTAGFEIIGLEQPKDGYGSGVALRLIKPGEPTQRAVFSSVLVPSKGDIVRTDVMDFQDQKITTHRLEALPGKVRKGRLRVARTGTTVSFLISEQLQGEGSFRLLREMSFGDEDVESVALLADTGGARSRLTVRLVSLAVRADRLPFGTAPPPPPPTPSPRGGPAWWSMAVLAALAGAVAMAGFLIHRRRRGPAPGPAVPAQPGQRKGTNRVPKR